MTHRGKPVDLTKIRRVALLTIEGEHDDISGVGQTQAAHRLCNEHSDDKKAHYLQLGVGHYGVFNGSRFRARDRAAHSTSCCRTTAAARAASARRRRRRFFRPLNQAGFAL